MSKTTKTVIIVLAVLVGLIMAGTAVAFVSMQPSKTGDRSVSQEAGISKSQLAQHDGLDGRECWVAVDGKVYLIKGFALWEMGRHTAPGADAARCGLDLSNVITQSPHGKSKLNILPVVGQLQN